jgi:iron(III) transport system substrate-binding protein
MRDSKPSRRNLLNASGALVASVVFPAPLKAAGPPPTLVSQSMIEAARRERMVAFYTAMEIPLAESLGRAFESKYPGLDVRVKRSGAERVFQRIGKEEDVSIYEVDVACSTDAGHFINWKRDGLLTPYVPEDVAKHFPPEQIDSDGMYATVLALLSPISYNTNLVRPELSAPRRSRSWSTHPPCARSMRL